MLWADVILVGAEFFFCKWFLHNPPAITLQNKVSQCKIWAIVYLLTYLIDKIPSCALGIQKILKDSFMKPIQSSWLVWIQACAAKRVLADAFLTCWRHLKGRRKLEAFMIYDDPLSLAIQSSLYLEGNSAG